MNVERYCIYQTIGCSHLNRHWSARLESLNSSTWFVCLIPLLFVWASKGSLRVTVFSLSLVSLLPCWARGILLQSCHDNYWTLLDIETRRSNSRKWGYFLTRHEQLPALRRVDVCQGQGTPIRVQSLSVVSVITSSSQSSAISSKPSNLCSSTPLLFFRHFWRSACLSERSGISMLLCVWEGVPTCANARAQSWKKPCLSFPFSVRLVNGFCPVHLSSCM